MIAVRLMRQVKEALKMNDVPTYFWSDSTTALAWIRRSENWSTFVRNRVEEIHKVTEPTQWRHVPGTLNPADLPSREVAWPPNCLSLNGGRDQGG